MVPRLQKFIRSVVDFAKKAKIALTWKVFFAYVLMALPLAFLFAILFDIFLYAFDPMRLPLPLIRLGTISWAILIGLAGFAGGLLARKRLLSYIKQVWGFIQSSLPAPQLKLTIRIASLITALIVLSCQAIVTYSSPPRTAIPNTPYSGMVVVNDPLTSNRLGWEVIPAGINSCVFTGDGYEVRANRANMRQSCFANKINLSDFAVQVDMTLKAGYLGGIWFRDRYQLLLLGNSYTDGYFELYAVTHNGYFTQLLPECNAIQTGCPIGESLRQQQTVTATIIARGTTIEVYIDTLKVKTLTNGVSSSGEIGLFAEIANGEQVSQADVLFANMRIWTDIA
jgi:hypothetical protein